MTQHSDIERLLDHWFKDGPDQAPDRVVEIVTDRIERQSQRPAWRLHWRPFPMNAYAKIAVAAAAILIVALVGYNLLPGSSTGVGGPAPSPSALPTATPTSTPAATGPVALPDGPVTGGRYRIKPFNDPSSLSIVADVPVSWVGFPANAALTNPGGSNGGILLGFMTADGLFRDPCHWDVGGTGAAQTGDIVVGPTVDDLVTALKANKSYTSSAATPVTIGGFEGQELELQLPGDDVISTCDRETGETTGSYFVFPNGFYAQGPNSRWHLYILDVAGTRLITMVSIAEGTPQADVAAATAIVESFKITP